MNQSVERVKAHDLIVQEARKALSNAGWSPLVHLGAAEHWVRDGQRCTLCIEVGLLFEDIACDQQQLESASHVHFVRLPCGTLITQ